MRGPALQIALRELEFSPCVQESSQDEWKKIGIVARTSDFGRKISGYNVAQQHAARLNRAEADEKTAKRISRLRKKPFAAPDVRDDLGPCD